MSALTRLPRLKRLLPLVAMLAAGTAAAQGDIRFLVGTNWTAPMAFFEDGRLTGGVLKDFAESLAQQSGQKVRITVLPRGRQEVWMKSGDIDLACFWSQRWLEKPDSLVWGQRPVVRFVDVIVGDPATVPIKSLDELPGGAVIGTTLGYKYPTIETRFADGRLRREDSPDETKVLLKIATGRTPYGVAKAMATDWYRVSEKQNRIGTWQFEVDATDVFCAVPRSSPANATALLAHVDRMITSGQVQRIFARYR